MPALRRKDLAGAVADDDLPVRHMIPLGNGIDKFQGIGIGVVDELFDVSADHRPQPPRRAQRIDVGAEIENRLAGAIGPPGQFSQVSAVSWRHVLPRCL